MRKGDDMRDVSDVRLEAEVTKGCNLSVEEVEGFRQIFSSVVNWTGELDLEALKELLLRVVDLSDEAIEELGDIVRKVHPHGREVARFPQFLKLVKTLTETNLLGVNDAAARSVRRAQMKKQRTMMGSSKKKETE